MKERVPAMDKRPALALRPSANLQLTAAQELFELVEA